ncbi:DUF924 family protein [Marimonas lutisalis]|uniref:DUF924 family protein n=1 Tax=Marimonas lutisalis TaxID=2545756 RepID=UPI0010F9743D|nr:DUF924 family protein [Marimonas lutisalis]
MNVICEKKHQPSDVLDLWFPATGHQESPETHSAFWKERMHGGMDEEITLRFSDLTLAAATGELDHWAETPRGRLALLIALDQFPRSLWRDTPAAFAQDIKATRLALDGIKNDDIDALAPWEMAFFVIAISHCEGPDHLERMQALNPLVDQIAEFEPAHLPGLGERFRKQHARITDVVRRFGRHPHRNNILGRPSTKAEKDYLAVGDFPHLP